MERDLGNWSACSDISGQIIIYNVAIAIYQAFPDYELYPRLDIKFRIISLATVNSKPSKNHITQGCVSMLVPHFH